VFSQNRNTAAGNSVQVFINNSKKQRQLTAEKHGGPAHLAATD